MNNDWGMIFLVIMVGVLLTFIILWIYSIVYTYGIPVYYQGAIVGLFIGAGLMFCFDRIDWEVYGFDNNE